MLSICLEVGPISTTARRLMLTVISIFIKMDPVWIYTFIRQAVGSPLSPRFGIE
jgi:hypothetical protein